MNDCLRNWDNSSLNPWIEMKDLFARKKTHYFGRKFSWVKWGSIMLYASNESYVFRLVTTFGWVNGCRWVCCHECIIGIWWLWLGTASMQKIESLYTNICRMDHFMTASTVEKTSYSQLNPHELFLYMYTMMLQQYYCFSPLFADWTP